MTMTSSIEHILASPDKKRETEYNIITTMSTGMKGYGSLIHTMTGGGNKKTHTSKKSILNNNQITIAGAEREKTRSEKRK